MPYRYRFLRFPNGLSKAVTLSYDDGSRHDIRMAEAWDRYGLKCTFNLNSEWVRVGKTISKEQIEDILSRGHEIAIHGAAHLPVGLVRPIDGIRDVLTGREELEQIFGRIIRGLAYPDTGITRFTNGSDYPTVRSYLQSLGIVYARTLGGDNDRFELPSDWYAWMPTAYHLNPDLPQLMQKFVDLDVPSRLTASRYPRLFYLWGHSYEFDRENRWDLVDAIGQTLGGHEDIWYATNMEIYDYVTGYRALVASADEKRVYNPSLFPIWFSEGDAVYRVDPGQTLVME